MTRKILVVILSIVVIGGLVGGFLYLKNHQKPNQETLSFIPSDALVIWRNSNPIETWHRLSNNSILWEEMKYITSVSKADIELRYLDSILANAPELNEILEAEPLYLSWHPTGNNNATWLATLGSSNLFDISDFKQFLKNSEINTEQRTFQEHTLYSWKWKTNTFHFYLNNNLLLLSPSGPMLEKAVLQLNSEVSLLHNKEFMKVYNTAGSPEHGVIFYNYQSISHLLLPFVKSNGVDYAKSRINHFGTWAVQDVLLKSNEVMTSGFSTYTDTLGQTLSWFEDQKPEDHDFIEVIPKNTAAFIHYGFSNLNQWFEKKRAAQELSGQLFAFDKQMADLENQYNFTYQNHLFSWMEHEVVCGALEGRDTILNNQVFAVTKASNIDLATKSLLDLERRAALLASDENTPSLDSSMHYIAIPKLLFPIFGKPFEKLTHPYFTIIDKYVIWANSQQVLREIIVQHRSESTLKNDDSFNQLEENISEESNVFLYANIARSAKYLNQFIHADWLPIGETDIEFLRKFQAITYQWSFERKGLFYTHGFFLHNPVYKEVSYSLWELALDAPASMKPEVVINHYTKAKEIFIQDIKNNIYLISNSGKILWKRPLSEPILSDVKQIDVYNNGKLQLLFNTKSKLFLIDRNGHDVEGFSVELPEKATAGLSLIDYTGSRQYRILIPTEGGKLHNYDNSGKEIKGWKQKPEEANIIRPIKYLVIKNKDYLLAELENGQVTAYDRRGRTRIDPLAGHFTVRDNPSFLHAGSSLDNSCLITSDSSGTVQKLFLDGRLEKEDYGQYTERNIYLYDDINGDRIPDNIIADKGKVVAYNNNHEVVFEVEIPTGDISAINTYQFETGPAIGITSEETDQIYLYDRTTQLKPFFPMNGFSPFTITDLNDDGNYNLIVGNSQGILYTYILEN